MNEEASYIRQQVMAHNKWFEESIPMIASENVISPLIKEMLISDFHDRYAEGLPGERYYHGNVYVDKVELKTEELARKVFNCDFADVRPISGTVANLAMLKALAKPGDIVTSCALAGGAHISTARFGAVGVRGVKRYAYPFDEKIMNLDIEGTKKVIKEKKPKVAIFGRSVFLFPAPLEELRDTLEEVGCYVWYDGAHVLGLIAAGRFQDPLREGADVISASTHKTFPGPQHGIILANLDKKGMEKKLRKGVFPGVTSNHHLHSMAGLGIALAEFREFGKEYADQVIRNAQALGQGLYERGIKVLCPELNFTASHTLAVDVKEHGGGEKISQLMEDSNMIANKNMLPWDTSPVSPSGIRLGSQEITRVGMKEKHMDQVAEFIHRVAVKKEDTESVKKDVIAFKKEFSKVQYCFGAGHPAYEYKKFL